MTAMMKIYNYIYLSASALLCGLLTLACSDESSVIETSGPQDVKLLVKVSDGVSVHTGSRAGEEEENGIFDRFPVGVDFREGASRIRVCSVDRSPGSRNFDPDYNVPYSIAEKDAHPTRYHEYICQKRYDYEQYSDFVCYDDAISLQWDKIDDNTGLRIPNTGNILQTTDGGGFYLFAAMYPYTYERPLYGESLIVNPDQTYNSYIGYEYGHYAAKLLVNDIRLCQKKYGYDHFRMPIQLDFFHSLCMLVVNVKVPLYHQSDGLGFKVEDIKAKWPPAMAVEKVGLAYHPRYDLVYDKDDAVRVEADVIRLGDIAMFRTPNFSNPDNIDLLTFKDEDSYFMDTEEYEGVDVPVMWVQFCAILPFQQLTDENTEANIHFSIAGKNYRCYFSKILEPVKLEQGHVTIVSMYIPRGDSDPILVGARLKDWVRKRTPIVSLQ